MDLRATEENGRIARGSYAIFILGLNIIRLFGLLGKKLYDTVIDVCKKSVSVVVSGFRNGILKKVWIANRRLEVPLNGMIKPCTEDCKTQTASEMLRESLKLDVIISETRGTASHSMSNEERINKIFIHHQCKHNVQDKVSLLANKETSVERRVGDMAQSTESWQQFFEKNDQSIPPLMSAIRHLRLEKIISDEVQAFQLTPQHVARRRIDNFFQCSSRNSDHDPREDKDTIRKILTDNIQSCLENSMKENCEPFVKNNDCYFIEDIEKVSVVCKKLEQVCGGELIAKETMGVRPKVEKNGTDKCEFSLRNLDVISQNDPVDSEDENFLDTCPLNLVDIKTCEKMNVKVEETQQEVMSNEKSKCILLIQTLKRILCPCLSFTKQKNNGRRLAGNLLEETETLI